MGSTLGIRLEVRAGKYIGMPTKWERSTQRPYREHLKKIDWMEEGLLSQARKETLIEAVINAMPIYF